MTAAAPHINATVMASAGSGKTWLLVTRIIRLLLENQPPDSILALTFTRKAAAEMQTRLGERLLELASAADSDLSRMLGNIGVTPSPGSMAQARALYEQLLRAPQGIRASTFHAFCQDILRRFPLEADVPPGFELAEKTGDLLEAAYAAVFNAATASPDSPAARALEVLFETRGGLHGAKAALAAFVAHRSDWWAYTDGQEDPVTFAHAMLRDQLQIREDADPTRDFFSATRVRELAEFAELLGRHATATNQKHAILIGVALSPSLPANERFSHARQSLLTGEGTRRARKPSKALADSLGQAGMARLLELHEQLCAAIEHTLDQLAARHTLALSQAWYIAGDALLGHFQRIKQEQRLLDFSDLEWKTYRLLNHADNALWVQYKLDQRIDHLLVDEFQDTNPTQWLLLLPLLEELAAGGAERSRSVFLVGDAKQSIYRFRRAEPRLFDAAQQWLAQRLNAENFPLAHSWRSAPAIIHFVNRLFRHPRLAECLVSFAPHSTHRDDLWGQVELLPLAADHGAEPLPMSGLRNPLEQPRATSRNLRYLAEGRAIARRIRELVEEGIAIPGNDGERPLSYRDIMILVRSRTHVRDYEQALREAAIPYLGADRGTLLQSLEISDMVALLQTLTAPFDNLALASVLRSPLFGCSDEDLIDLAAAGPAGTWMERLERLAAQRPAQSPLRRASQLLGQWQSRAGILPVHDLLDRIYAQGNVMARYHAGFPGHLRPRVAANLTRLLELALEIDSGRYPSLMRFLAQLEQLRVDTDAAPDEAPSLEGGDRVRLLTIHAAKGLEATVVFLADATATVQMDYSHRPIVQWPPEAAGPTAFLLSAKKEAQDAHTRRLLEDEVEQQAREDANLLYVAVTRARQRLIVSGSTGDKVKDSGWYGLIAEAYDRDLSGMDAASTLERNGQVARAVTPPAPAQPPAPDPRLRQPIASQIPLREIAPSLGHASPAEGADDSMEGIGRRRREHAVDEDGLLRGRIIHRLLELLTAPAPQASRALHRTAGEFGLSSDDALLAECHAEAQAVIQDSRYRDWFDPQRYEAAYNEVPLLYEHQGQTVHGIIDRLVINTDGITLIDYKTHRHANAHNLPELARNYTAQMQWYAEGVSRLWPGRPVRTVLLFTDARAAHSPTHLTPERL